MNMLARLAVVACLALPMAVVAQSKEDSALVGVRAVDARLELDWSSRIEAMGGPEESQMRLVMQQRLTLELRKLGIQVSTQAPSVLTCAVTLVTSSQPVASKIIAYRFQVALTEWVTQIRLARQIAATVWDRESAHIVGVLNLKDALEGSATECAEQFGNAWLSVNPRP